MTVDDVMALAPVVPVLVVHDASDAAAMAHALVAGGLKALEVTLRTPAAFEAIAEMARVEGAVVGAGTVINERQLDRAITAGARFIVSPGLTDRLGRAAIERGIPYLPGIANAGDIMRGLDLGLTRFKFFPAMAAGGIPALRALSAPFYDCRFCPTGGITPATASDWLALDEVGCVGGSWLVETNQRDFSLITERATQAASLKR